MAVYNFKDADLNQIEFREYDLSYWRSRFFGNQYYITESNLCFQLIGTDQYLLMHFPIYCLEMLINRMCQLDFC